MSLKGGQGIMSADLFLTAMVSRRHLAHEAQDEPPEIRSDGFLLPGTAAMTWLLVFTGTVA